MDQRYEILNVFSFILFYAVCLDVLIEKINIISNQAIENAKKSDRIMHSDTASLFFTCPSI